MKTRLTIGIVWAALAGTLTFVAASSVKREQVTEADALPAYEVLTTVRSMGLNPVTDPVRRGTYYVLQATDPRGVEVRVVADAQFGDILSVVPARASSSILNIQRGPRIIQVPQPGDRASVNERDEPVVTNDDDDDEVVPQPRATPPVRTKPRAPQRSDAPLPASRPVQRRSDAPPPPPPGPRRVLLSTPPAEGPTPVRPTPKFNAKTDRAKTDNAEKFGPPRDITPSPPPPPLGYSPPAALPPSD